MNKQINELNYNKIEKKQMETICQLIDNKANIEDSNRVFQEMQTQIDSKQNKNEFMDYSRKQKELNVSLMKTSLVAKYVWKGITNKGSIVYFDEIFNNLGDQLIYKGGLLNVMKEGYYMIEFGFYGNKKPNIQIQINGETIVSAMNSHSYVVHHSSGRLKDIQHSGGNITGKGNQ